MPLENQQDRDTEVSRLKQTISRLAQGGDIEKARLLCTSLCEQAPDDPEAWFLLGAIHGAVPDYPEAERCCRKAIALAPNHPMLKYNLAVALINQEKSLEAIEQLKQVVSLQPQSADAYRELGNAHNQIDELLQAVSCYRKSIELDPGSAATHYNLGRVYQSLNRLEEAAQAFQHAVNLQPEFVDAISELSSTLIQQFKFDKVIDLLREATSRLPGAAPLYPLLAVAYQEQGDADIALKYYKKALSLDPESVTARVGVAGILALQGKYEESRELLEELLISNPENATIKITFATFAHHFNETDKAIAMAERELGESGTSPRTLAKFHFSLAPLYEKKGDLDTAFEHYLKGNQLRNAHYDHASYEQMFRAIMESFSEQALSTLPRSENTSDRNIFIVGMPRSGTSLAEHILASHPNVFGAGELRNINYMADNLQKPLDAPTPYPLCIDLVTTDALNSLAEQYQQEVAERSGYSESFITDKMPLNFMHLGFISLLFPNARIIHCTRDPRDTCLSCFFKHFSGELPYTYSLTDIGKFYRLYQRLMAHWKLSLPSPIFELNYENMVLNQESETQRLLEFCGLPWDDACLEFHKTERTVATASHGQVRQPMYSRSIGRWRDYEKHLSPLFDALRIDT